MRAFWMEVYHMIIKSIKQLLHKKEMPDIKNVIKKADDFMFLGDGNALVGTPPRMDNSSVSFGGKNNILFCGPGVELCDCTIAFNADNSLVYLSQSEKQYRISISINNNCVCFIGKNNYFNGILHIILSEHKHLFIGNNCLFSFDIWVRNADPHLIYDSATRKRLNQTKSIFVGDHVWIGQSAMILKGSKIDSGCIIGAKSVVTGPVSHNSVWVGNPIRKVRESVFWDGACVHKWTKADTDKNQLWHDTSDYIFEYNEKEELSYVTMDEALDGTDIIKKIDYLNGLSTTKNRFVHKAIE